MFDFSAHFYVFVYFTTFLAYLTCRVIFHINQHRNYYLIVYQKSIQNLDDLNVVWF